MRTLAEACEKTTSRGRSASQGCRTSELAHIQSPIPACKFFKPRNPDSSRGWSRCVLLSLGGQVFEGSSHQLHTISGSLDHLGRKQTRSFLWLWLQVVSMVRWQLPKNLGVSTALINAQPTLHQVGPSMKPSLPRGNTSFIRGTKYIHNLERASVASFTFRDTQNKGCILCGSFQPDSEESCRALHGPSSHSLRHSL